MSPSWNGNPSTTISQGIVYGVIVVCPPCSSAAAAVITFAVLPGWNTSATGMSVAAAAIDGKAGLNDGAWASVRIRPVLGCMTTAVQLSASTLRTCAAQACSASY